MMRLDLSSPSWEQTAIVLAIATALVYTVTTIVYNLYFHPLSRFPGPKLASSTLLWRMYHTLGGRFHRAVDEQHAKYGDVFRVAPNELSFASVESWKGIYGFPQAGKSTFVKSKFYEMYGSGFDSLCIGSERDPRSHNRMKRSLSAAFSTKALNEQEAIVADCVNSFVRKVRWLLESRSVASKVVGLHQKPGKPHHWAEMIVDHLYFITVADNLRQFPFFVFLARQINPYLGRIKERHTKFTREKVERRLVSPTSRKDFFTQLAAKVESGEMEKEELTAHASTLVIAGGETIATFLAATTYHLLHAPEAYAKLRHEVRAQFTSYDEIDSSRALQIPYLQAVISEGLRIYPPGSQGFPRISPGAYVGKHWVPAGAEVYTSAWTLTHDSRYWHEPHAFRPERWLDEECKDTKEASQPFSLGPRGCLGRNFAYIEMALVLAKMHWKYDMEMVNVDMSWEEQSRLHVMWSKPELWVRFHKRQM